MRRVLARAPVLALLVALPVLPASAEAPARPARPAREGPPPPVTIDADRMERYGKDGLVVFIGNVVARREQAVHYADRMEVYLDARGENVLRTVSTGNVKIVTRDCRTGTARRAEHIEIEQRLVLQGDARVWQDDNVVTGETITLHLAEDRSLAEARSGERVKAVFQRKPAAKGAAASPARAPCAG